MSTRTALSRPTILIAAIAALALSMLYLANPVGAAGFTPGQDGHPTTGESTDLKGGTGTFTFQTNAILSCDGDTASSFSFHIDYTITSGGPLPAGAVLVVYLSPNQGAINNNGGSDPQGYIDDVQSNFNAFPITGLNGSGTLDVVVTVGTPFELSGGGVLGVIANDASDTIISTSKSNSVQCSEAQSVAESASAAESVPASAEQSVEASGEQSQKAGEGTPEESQSDSALAALGSSPLATIAFSLILLASLGALAYANVKTVRSRI